MHLHPSELYGQCLQSHRLNLEAQTFGGVPLGFVSVTPKIPQGVHVEPAVEEFLSVLLATKTLDEAVAFHRVPRNPRSSYLALSRNYAPIHDAA